MTHRRHAFTLLELLTVIAILGLLMGILIPTLRSARLQAKSTACQAALREIGSLFSLYHHVNQDTFPPVRMENVAPGSSEDYINDFKRRAPRWPWFVAGEDSEVIYGRNFNRYIVNQGYFDDNSTASLHGASPRGMTVDTFLCPSLTDPRFQRDIRDGAFGYNYQYLGNTRTDVHSERWDNFPVKLHSIKKPSGMVLAADSRGVGRDHGPHSYMLDPPRVGWEVNARRYAPTPDQLTSEEIARLGGNLDEDLYRFSPVEMRHRGKGNVAFVDAHVDSLNLSELGYQIYNAPTAGKDRGQALPVHSENELPNLGPGETYTFSNQLFNGEGRDTIAEQMRR